jgi:hypothetical protein
MVFVPQLWDFIPLKKNVVSMSHTKLYHAMINSPNLKMDNPEKMAT